MESRVQRVKKDNLILRGHVDNFEMIRRLSLGEKLPLATNMIPRMVDAGVDVVIIALGGDGNHQRAGSERPMWGSLRVLDLFLEELKMTDLARVITDPSDIPDAPNGVVSFIMEFEGASPLEGSLSHLRNFYRLGLRYMQLTHNERNDLADGVFDECTGGKLSRFGIDVVREMNRLGMVIGLSHLNEPGFWQVLELTDSPVLATHSNARAILDIPRNLSDQQLKALAANGGTVGIHACQFMLCEGQSTFDAYFRHLDHVVGLIGPEHVGVGLLSPEVEWRSAFEKAEKGKGYLDIKEVIVTPEYPNGLTLDQQNTMFVEQLLKRGYSEEDISWILGKSFLRVFKEVMKKS
ncbi:MAG: dipeptidase [Limnochordia bacterium]|nr:dipeptidase [Limnochordia bacterium]